jgi:membrane protease YdiL (CAAX protease family)
MATRTPRDLSSYLRIARPDRGAVWRLAVGVLAATVGFFAVTLVALLAVVAAIRLGGGHLVVDTDHVTPELLLATNLGLALCIPLAGCLIWTIYGLRPHWLGSVAPGLRLGWLATCSRIAGTIWGVLFLLVMLAVAVSPDARFDGQVVGFLVVAALTTPLQAAGEEYLFRGFLLQSLGATRLPALVCWGISGVLFATAHGQFAPPLFADRLLIGVVFAWLATSTGGLEASIALHAIKNLSVLVPAAILGELSGAIDPKGVTWLPFALDAVMLGLAAWWIRSRYRRVTLPPPPPDVWPGGSRAG